MRDCKTPYCGNKAAKHRTVCHKCKSQKFKESKPFRYFYNLHKQKAKQRCVPWKLSFQQYKKVWLESGKWDEKLAGVGDWSMDRIDINRGYEIENVRIIPISLNVKVWHDTQRWRVDFRWRKMWSERNGKSIEDCPF